MNCCCQGSLKDSMQYCCENSKIVDVLGIRIRKSCKQLCAPGGIDTRKNGKVNIVSGVACNAHVEVLRAVQHFWLPGGIFTSAGIEEKIIHPGITRRVHQKPCKQLLASGSIDELTILLCRKCQKEVTQKNIDVPDICMDMSRNKNEASCEIAGLILGGTIDRN